MKRFIFPLLLLVLLSQACNQSQDNYQATNPSEDPAFYGEKISPEGALPLTQLPHLLAGKDSVQAKLVGTVVESCRNKGCWMKMEGLNGTPVRVTFKDYGFFVPKGLQGETAVLEGVAYADTVSVEELRHFAQDAGKSEAEIAAITAPEPTITFVANGVIIQ